MKPELRIRVRDTADAVTAGLDTELAWHLACTLHPFDADLTPSDRYTALAEPAIATIRQYASHQTLDPDETYLAVLTAYRILSRRAHEAAAAGGDAAANDLEYAKRFDHRIALLFEWRQATPKRRPAGTKPTM